MVGPAEVDYCTPLEADIEVAVQDMKRVIPGVSLGTNAEDLKGRLREAKREKEPARIRWERITRIVQLVFGYGTVLEEIDWSKMVLLTKGKGKYQGIALVEVMHKVCAAVVNCRLNQSVEMHNTIHGLRGGRVTGTATLEAKLAQHLAGIEHKPIFQDFQTLPHVK